MTGSRIRVFIDDGPRGGEFALVEAGPEGRPRERITLGDPVELPGVALDELADALPAVLRRESDYELAGRHDESGAHLYRWVRPGLSGSRPVAEP